MAFLAGHLDFSTALWRTQTQPTLGAAEIAIQLPITESGLLKGKPADNRVPHTQKRLILPLAGGKIAGKHPEQHPEIKQVGEENQRPEKQLCHQRKHNSKNQAGQRQLVGAIAPHHPILKSLQPTIHHRKTAPFFLKPQSGISQHLTGNIWLYAKYAKGKIIAAASSSAAIIPSVHLLLLLMETGIFGSYFLAFLKKRRGI